MSPATAGRLQSARFPASGAPSARSSRARSARAKVPLTPIVRPSAARCPTPIAPRASAPVYHGQYALTASAFPSSAGRPAAAPLPATGPRPRQRSASCSPCHSLPAHTESVRASPAPPITRNPDHFIRKWGGTLWLLAPRDARSATPSVARQAPGVAPGKLDHMPRDLGRSFEMGTVAERFHFEDLRVRRKTCAKMRQVRARH